MFSFYFPLTIDFVFVLNVKCVRAGLRFGICYQKHSLARCVELFSENCC